MGSNEGSLADCYSRGDVNSMLFFAGGLVGHNDGSMTHCYSTGEAKAGGASVRWSGRKRFR